MNASPASQAVLLLLTQESWGGRQVNRRLKRSLIGAGTCAVAVLVTTLLTGESGGQTGAQIVVPQEQDSGSDIRKPPPSSVSVILPSPPIETPGTTSKPPIKSENRQPTAAAPRPAPTTPAKPAAVDFQAEDARIHRGSVQSNHPGFTGSGFVDYANEPGSSVEWTVTAPTTGAANAVFRFANGSNTSRPTTITVNGILVASIAFPVTNGWSDWRTVTVPMNLLAGTNKIRAVATTGNGGPNIDKITVTLAAS